ncbi:MAG: lipoyl synthase [Methylophilaceae bacterium]|jgi:lipoyl synthase|nr:lipoyl synthase [Methylophilaceae bacterium]
MSKNTQHRKEIGKSKTARIPIKIIPAEKLKKPNWIKMQLPNGQEFSRVKSLLSNSQLNTVCEEASCPNIGECFSQGTATFMILGDLCTRRCPFCDVAHGRPSAPDVNEPKKLATTIRQLNLKYVVITSVDRDDLRDGGAQHFVDCIKEIRRLNTNIRIEILVPDFRGREIKALNIIATAPPDVFNHNLETIPRLYKQARPGSDYNHSLKLLLAFKKKFPDIVTKSGLMLGLGESLEEINQVLIDLKRHQIDMVTLGQYLQPTEHHLPVKRYVTPLEFDQLKQKGESLGFSSIASGPMVRSSYHADTQSQDLII